MPSPDLKRQEIIDRISQMQRVVDKTDSVYLRRDYLKGIKRLKRELRFYDQNHSAYYNR